MMPVFPIFYAESWLFAYLLNALWQVPIIWAAAWIMTRLARRTGPVIEHRIWVGAMVVEVVLPACRMHGGELFAMAWSILLRSMGGGTSDGNVRILIGPAHAIGRGWRLLSPPVLTALCAGYACALLYFVCRLAWGFWQTRTLAQKAEPAVLRGSAARAWTRLQISSEPRSFVAEVAVSRTITGPITVGVGTGFRRMLVLLPEGYIENVPAEDFTTVLAHEYAHIRRRDFTKNLLYTITSLPIAWHPLFRLTRTCIAESREMVCDAWAAHALAGSESYARSLLRLAASLSVSRAQKNLHAIGIFDANNFERRIMKLTRRSSEIRGIARMAAIAGCVLAGVVVCTSALALRLEPSAGMVDPPKQLHVKAADLQGNLVKQVQPVYPPAAKKAGIQGAVILNIVISKEGVPENLSVVSGRHQLQGSALDAVRQWRYKPYLLNGEPVEVISTVTITYSLGG